MSLADKLLRETTASLSVPGGAAGFSVPHKLSEPKRSSFDSEKRTAKLKKRRGETDEEFDETVSKLYGALGLSPGDNPLPGVVCEDDTQDLHRMSGVVEKRCNQISRFLRKKQLGVTAQAFHETAQGISKQQKERSGFEQLMDSERVLMSSVMKTADLTVKLGALLKERDFHDYCQELRPEVEGLNSRITELTGEGRRLSERQLEHDESINLQLYKFRESVRDWADAFDDRVTVAAARYF